MDALPNEEATRDETPSDKAPAVRRAKWETPKLTRLGADEADLAPAGNADGVLAS
jgi:hypothetical protein